MTDYRHLRNTFQKLVRMPRTWISILLCCMVGSAATAQQRPHYTQYILNNYILNPAISGIENYADLKLSVRNQWVGIDGAPTTYYGSLHAPIGKKDFGTNATSMPMKGENPRGRQYWLDYQAAPAHHGIGVQFINYRTGYINRFNGMVTYAYHIPVGLRTTLAAGFGAGVLNVSVDRSKITLANPIDPAIGSGTSEIRMTRPDLSAGLWLYGSDFFIGLSAQQIIPTRVGLVDKSLDRSTLVPHIMSTAGYRFFISEDISLLPSAMVRYIPSMPVFMDMNLKAQYRDLLWLGANARLTEGFSAMAGINISNTFNVSYSYDLSRTRFMLGMMQRGTHEIVIGFLLNNSYGDTCPRNVW
jgi:type IX secretion system PorP/SprF family membrane protein